MLLLSERVSEINFPAIWRPKIQKNSLWCAPWEHFMEQTVKKLNLCWRAAVDKSVWIKTWLYFPVYSPNSPKNENFKTIRPGDIILHKCTKNHDHMLHCSWDMARVGYNCYCSFWAIFSPFTARPPPPAPPNNPKKENFTKMKKSTWRYQHFTQVYQKSWSYAVLFLRYRVWQM